MRKRSHAEISYRDESSYQAAWMLGRLLEEIENGEAV